jgi:hypothetical protein
LQAIKKRLRRKNFFQQNRIGEVFKKMNSPHEAKLKMYRAVETHCDANAAITAIIRRFFRAKIDSNRFTAANTLCS